MVWQFQARYRSYLEPWQPLVYGVWAAYTSAKQAFTNGEYSALGITKLRDSGFYLWFKTLSLARPPYPTTPNENFVRFESNQTAVPDLVLAASGLVLELGPGLGNQLCRFDKTKVTRIIGVENNPHFAPDIQQRIREHGLEGMYELLTCGIEDGATLDKHGIDTGTVDTVLSIQVLCSVADPDAVAKELYRVLKPGGKFIFWEHNRSADWLTAAVQYFWNPAWRLLVGGCSMTRNNTATILAAGEWENATVIKRDEKPWGMLPRTWGVLVKPERPM